MLIDQHVETNVEENNLPQQNIHRLANGSIDYTFYDTRARSHRGVAFRAAGRSVTAFVQRMIGLLVHTRPEPQQVRQPKTKLMQARPRLQRGDKCIETATTSRKTYSEAA